MAQSSTLTEASRDAEAVRRSLQELVASVETIAGKPRRGGADKAGTGFKTMKSKGPSKAALAASEATERAHQLGVRATFLAAVGILVALAWVGLWFQVHSDFVQGRLTELHVPVSVSLPLEAPAEAAKRVGDISQAVGGVLALLHGNFLKMLGLAMFITGVGAAVVKQSLVPAVTGIAGALLLMQGPLVVGQILGQQPMAQQGSAVQVFEQDKDLDKLRRSLSRVQLSPHAAAYLLGQAIVLEAGKQPVSAQRREELKSHLETVRGALASGVFVDGKAHPVYAMEVAAYGKGTTGEAGNLQRNAELFRWALSKLHPGWMVLGWGVPMLLILIAMGVAFDRARVLAEAADPASTQKAAERFRASLIADPHRVPFVRTYDSRDIEATIRAIEMAGETSR